MHPLFPRRFFAAVLLCAPAFAHPAHAAAERDSRLVPETADGQVPLVIEAAPAGTASVAGLVESLGGRVTYRFRNMDAVAVTVPPDAIPALLADGRVASAARQHVVRRAVEPVELPRDFRGAAAPRVALTGSRRDAAPDFLPLDSGAGFVVTRPAAIDARGSDPESFFGYDVLTGAAQSWNATDAGAGVIVAIVDTGIYPDHPLFQGNVVGGENLVPADEEQAIDADGDSAPDGFSFDWDAVENDSHGTFCAGLVAGHADLVMPSDSPLAESVALHSPKSITVDGDEATIRLRGTAPSASLFAMKVFPYDGGGAPDARVAEAIDRLVEMKKTGALDVDVISMSLSGPVLFDGFNPLDRMVDVATLHGITCVSAASNDGPSLVTVGSPGSAKTSLTCGAAMDPIHTRVAAEVAFGLPTGTGGLLYATEDPRMIEFSARGLTADGRVKPDLVATGFLMFSSGLFDANGDGLNDTPTFGFGSGTSFSTPTIAGAAALVTAYGDKLGALGQAPFVANVIKKAAIPIDEFASLSRREQGRGFVHVPGALTLLEEGAYFAPGPEDAAHSLAERRNVLDDPSGATPDLEPGTSYTVFLEVPGNVALLEFTFETVTLSSNENPIFGESIGAVIHTAKRGGAGDYVFETNPFAGGLQPGQIYTLRNPEPGTVRLTFSAIGFNYGPASASWSVRTIRESYVPTAILDGFLTPGTTAVHEVDVPAGLEAVSARLRWGRDWRRFPTVDLDLAIETPAGPFAAATLDSPEIVRIEDPAPGKWTFSITDLGTGLENEFYELDLNFVLPKIRHQDRLEEDGARIVSAGPNPAAGSAEVRFALPRRDSARVRVFDVTGRLVRTIAEGPFEAGAHRVVWDGVNGSGERVRAGVYFVRLDTMNGASVRKITLVE